MDLDTRYIYHELADIRESPGMLDAPDEVKASFDSVLSSMISDTPPDTERVIMIEEYLQSLSEDDEGFKVLIAGLEEYRKKQVKRKAG